ncbi:MAG: dihydrolipoamide acetyltransferase family protein [Symbiobacteriia bacterium]
MPQLGESVTEGTIAKWFKQPGDRVEKYEALAEVITDKVNAEVPAPVAGIITKISVPEGTTVAVKQEICRIDETGAGAGVAAGVAARPGAIAASTNNGAVASPAVRPSASAPASAAGGPPTGVRPANAPGVGAAGQAGRYSPAVLRLAQEHGIDLTDVPGTGLEGRVTRKDVQGFIDGQGAGGVAAGAPPAAARAAAAPTQATAPAAAATATPSPTAPAIPPAAVSTALEQAQAAGDQIIEPDPVRRRIAERMVQSVREAPHAWMMMEVDLTDLVRLRQQAKAEFQRQSGAPLTYLPFVIKAVVESLREFPEVNAAWIDGKLVVRRRVNISVAIATEKALVVPVIKDADEKSIAGLAHAVVDLASRARAGKLTLDDISGGTFTVDNTGSFGSVASAPIINPPQAAILTIEAITPRPVVRNDAIAIRQMVNLCMSFDHRVVDGLAAGHFLQAVKRRLENYTPDTPLY